VRVAPSASIPGFAQRSATVAGIRLHHFSNCGHFMPEEQPEFVIDHILNLCARVGASSGRIEVQA